MRARLVANNDKIIITSSKKFYNKVISQIKELGFKLSNNFIILEPCIKNTAAAVVISALHGSIEGQDPLIWIKPTDHLIEDEDLLSVQIKTIAANINKGEIALLGIKNDNPINSDFGYIIAEHNTNNAILTKIIHFIEKPNVQQIQPFINHNILINSGMFLAHASTIINACKKINPNYLDLLKTCYEKSQVQNNLPLCLQEELFQMLPAFSFDQLVIEKHDSLLVSPLVNDWIDIGNWQRLFSLKNSKPLIVKNCEMTQDSLKEFQKLNINYSITQKLDEIIIDIF